MKVSWMKPILYIWEYMNFYLYFPQLLSGLDEIWYKSSAHNAVEHLWLIKSGTGKAILFLWL
jgi:hypothetical protein